jgi:hypothetical protein
MGRGGRAVTGVKSSSDLVLFWVSIGESISVDSCYIGIPELESRARLT